MSISWGIKDRFKFVAAGPLSSWDPPSLPAVYAITYNQQASRPKSHTMLYCGHSEDLSKDAHELNEQVKEAWKVAGRDIAELFVFVHPMQGSTSSQRVKVQEQLVVEYRLQCNR